MVPLQCELIGTEAGILDAEQQQNCQAGQWFDGEPCRFLCQSKGHQENKKVFQGRVFVRFAQGAPALMLLQCEESGSVVTPPQGSTTSLEFEGHTTGIVPFIEVLGAMKMGLVCPLPHGSKIATWKSAPMSELPKDTEEIALCSPGHAPNEHRERQLKRLESSMPQPIPSWNWKPGGWEGHFGEPKGSDAWWSEQEASQVGSKNPTRNCKDALVWSLEAIDGRPNSSRMATAGMRTGARNAQRMASFRTPSSGRSEWAGNEGLHTAAACSMSGRTMALQTVMKALGESKNRNGGQPSAAVNETLP
eukprot:jgi/Bigna1/76147/fgenesh1_pg.39_\